MRGYSLLKKTNRLGLVRNIKNALVDCRFDGISKHASGFFFGASLVHAELITRQFLLQRNAYPTLHKSILYSFGSHSASIVHPFPNTWQKLLQAQGLNVNRLRSTAAWFRHVFLYWGHGVIIFLQLFITSLRAVIDREPRALGRFAYFEGLSSGNLPHPGGDGHSHDILTWYSRWNGRANNLNALCHGVSGVNATTVQKFSVEYIGHPYQPLNTFRNLVLFLLWGIKAVFLSLLNAARGQWWYALLLAEAAKAKIVQLSDAESLAADYLFHYSSTIYRPMWTYEAESRGSRIISYFYSTSEQVKMPYGYESLRYEWGAASWPMYLVWDEYQEALIRPEIGNHCTIEIVGPIWFATSSKELTGIPIKSIAVFDIQPHRNSAHFGFTTLAEFVEKHPDFQIRFLKDIHEVLSEAGISMVFKRKREIGKNGVKRYIKFVQQLSQSSNVVLADPAISAIRVIEKCRGIISMPFTSTALYLRDQEIPSVYYDPTGWIQKDDRGAHGITILSGIHELRSWVKEVFDESPVRNC